MKELILLLCVIFGLEQCGYIIVQTVGRQSSMTRNLRTKWLTPHKIVIGKLFGVQLSTRWLTTCSLATHKLATHKLCSLQLAVSHLRISQ